MIEKLTDPVYPDITNPIEPIVPTGVVIEETTDDHKKKYEPKGGSVKDRAPGLSGITSDQEILTILKLYKSPIGLSTPAHWTFSNGGSRW